MKKYIFTFLILSLVISNYSLVIAEGESWQEMMDSTKFYQEKRDIQTSLVWAQKALPIAKKEFGELDTNYINTLDAIANSLWWINTDSSFYYRETCLSICRKIYKNDDPVLAKNIYLLSSYYSWGHHVQQIPEGKEPAERKESLLNECLDMYKRLLNNGNIELFGLYVGASTDLSMLYRYNSNYKKAELNYLESINSCRKLISEGNTELIKNLPVLINSLAFHYRIIGASKKEEKLYKEILDIRRKLISGDNWDVVESLRNLASCYYRKGNFKQAEDYFNESLAMSKRLFEINYKNDENASFTYFNSYLNAANFFQSMGNYEQVEFLYLEILKSFKRLNPGDDYDLKFKISIIYNNLALFHKGKKDYKKAVEYYKESLILNGTEEDIFTIQLLLGLADLYKKIDKSTEADSLYKKCLGIYNKKINSNSDSLNNQHFSVMDIDNNFEFYDNNKELYEFYNIVLNSDRQYYKNDTFKLSNIICKMATRLRKIGYYKQAESLLIESLEMLKQKTKDNWETKKELFTPVNGLAELYTQMKDFKKAESFYIDAFEIRKIMEERDNNNFIFYYKKLADFYSELQNYEKAEPLYIEFFEMRKRLSVDDNPELTKDKTNLAEFYSKKADFTKAETLFLEVLDNYKNMLNDYFPSLSEREKKMFWNTVSENFEGFNSFAVKRYVENPNILSNMYDMQLYSKALLFNATSKVKKRILNSNDSVLIDKYKEWSDKKEFLVKLYSMQQDSLKKKGFNIDSIEALANELEKELSLKSEQFAQSYEKKKVNWKSIQALLKPDEAAVEVVRFRFRDGKRFTDTVYYAFLIVNEQTEEHPELVLLENGSQLENEYYNDYREKIKSRDEDKNSFSRYWGKLYDKLKDYKKLYFSTDGIYNKLNPATLQMPDGKYLLDIQDIHQVNSTKDIILGYYQNRQESNIYNSAVLIGNPNFSMEEEKVKELSQRIRGEADEEKVYEPLAATRGIELTKLPGTEKEINDINELLKSRKWDVKTYLGDMALKTAVKTVSNPRVLHIATHGMFLEDVKRESNKLFGFDEQRLVENPLLRSGLFFTGADNYLKSDYIKPMGEENGLLTAYEAMNLDLDRTELVVLSACETGLGEIKNGEGVFGLRRAFQQAGAKTVVMSLWTVNDDATQELMSNFYSNWVTGMTKRDAFSKAQQTVKEKFKDPYYWGAFVMVGE